MRLRGYPRKRERQCINANVDTGNIQGPLWLAFYLRANINHTGCDTMRPRNGKLIDSIGPCLTSFCVKVKFEHICVSDRQIGF